MTPTKPQPPAGQLIRQIDPKLIDDTGVACRLGDDAEAQRALERSLRQIGQQVPVLLRPSAAHRGRFEIIYGRRRLRVLRALGQPVNAMIRQMDDEAQVLAQGHENTARQELSFMERARFATQLAALGYARQTIADALSVDLPMVSRLLKLGGAFDCALLQCIGAAPGIGRARWTRFAALLEPEHINQKVCALARRPGAVTGPSDARFEQLFAHAQDCARAPGAAGKPRSLRLTDGQAVADIRRTAKGVSLHIRARGAGDFGTWVEAHAEAILIELHGRYAATQDAQIVT